MDTSVRACLEPPLEFHAELVEHAARLGAYVVGRFAQAEHTR